MQKYSPLILITFLLFSCNKPTTPEQVFVPIPEHSSRSVVSSAVSAEAPVRYVAGICGSEIPATWHVRSANDQALWNREGNDSPPSVLTADMIFQKLQAGDAVPFKPAVFSMAESDIPLTGHSEDPGAEDANRNEIDVLHITVV